MTKDEARKEEIARNYDYLMRNLARFMLEQAGRYATISHQRIVGFYDDPLDAARAGRGASGDGLYSIQEVTDQPVDLGIYALG